MMASPPSWSEHFAVFGKIGLLSFGGPAAQIALMHKVLVEERKWLSDPHYLNALAFCMLLPGPEAMQLATYAGWRLRGVAGGLVAGGLFVLPGACIVLGLSWLYVLYGDLPVVAALFIGVKAAVLIIVIEALLRVARRSLKSRLQWGLAGLAFLALFAVQTPYPFVIAIAALVGAVWLAGSAPSGESSPSPARGIRASGLVLVAGGVVWLAPLAVLPHASPVLGDVAQFFSTLAVVTFGGAYAVLAYMAQDAVGAYGWLTQGEMMDGLGLAETTPGPLILVTQFVGFLAGYREAGWTMALAATAVTLWATFVPCFLWIFAGAPHIEWIASKPRLAGALAGVMSAVVGVILNLSLWFALHTLFSESAVWSYGRVRLDVPNLASVDFPTLALILIAAIMMLRFKVGLSIALPTLSVLGMGSVILA